MSELKHQYIVTRINRNLFARRYVDYVISQLSEHFLAALTYIFGLGALSAMIVYMADKWMSLNGRFLLLGSYFGLIVVIGLLFSVCHYEEWKNGEC